MRRLTLLLLNLAVCPAALAGWVSTSSYSELDGSFGGATPGRVTVPHDVPGTQFTDVGINAFSDTLGRITVVSQVDIANVDTNLVGIGLARLTYNGALDNTFNTTGKRVKDAFLTSVVDACVDPSGHIVVAGTTPGADGSSGSKDLALVRFNADGSDDTSFGGDGGIGFSMYDTVTDYDESVRDVDCLSNGNILVAGWARDSANDQVGFIAEMSSTGATTPVRHYALGGIGTDTAVFTMAREADVGVIAAAQTAGANNLALIYSLQPNGSGYNAVAGRASIQFGGSSSICGTIQNPQFFGAARIGSGGDFALSGLRSDGVNNIPMLVRIQFGESVLTHCTDIGFGIDNAYVPPPVALADHVFVALGFQPFGSGPLTSRMRAFIAPADGSALTPAPGFGVDGVAQWSYTYHSSSSNNNRSQVQRLYVDPGSRIMAVGTRIWNGADTDAVLVRFGSSGVFNDGFETPL